MLNSVFGAVGKKKKISLKDSYVELNIVAGMLDEKLTMTFESPIFQNLLNAPQIYAPVDCFTVPDNSREKISDIVKQFIREKKIFELACCGKNFKFSAHAFDETCEKFIVHYLEEQ